MERKVVPSLKNLENVAVFPCTVLGLHSPGVSVVIEWQKR